MSLARVGSDRRNGEVQLLLGEQQQLVLDGAVDVPAEVILGARPEHTRLWESEGNLLGPIDGTVEYVESLGRETLIGVEAAGERASSSRPTDAFAPSRASRCASACAAAGSTSSTRTPSRHSGGSRQTDSYAGKPHNHAVSRLERRGEGFEPSSDLTARNGFRDRHEHGDLQALCISFASLFASQRHLTVDVFADLTTLPFASLRAALKRKDGRAAVRRCLLVRSARYGAGRE